MGSKAAINSNGNCLRDTETIPPGEGNGDEEPLPGDGRSGSEFQNLAQLSQTFATAGLVASQVTQDIIAGALDGDIEPDSGGASPIVTGAGAVSGMFMVSGYKTLSHDGFSISSSAEAANGQGPSFDEDNYGLTIGTRFDGSTIFDTAPGVVTLGFIANYTHTDIEVDAPSGSGLSNGGSADVDSFSAGGYGLVTDGKRYGLVTITGTYGTPETSSAVIPSEANFDNFAIATSALAGMLIPVGDRTKIDLRGGFNYIHATSDDYEDSEERSFTDGRMEEFSGTISVRVFSVIQGDDYKLRPFVQGGITHRFHYKNELKIDGESFAFDEADTSVFARVGVDFNIDQSTQAYLAVRGDASEDYEAIAAQVGVTFKLD